MSFLEEKEEIYAALSKILLQALLVELEPMNYMSTKDGRLTVTRKGKTKLEAFKSALTTEERRLFEP